MRLVGIEIRRGLARRSTRVLVALAVALIAFMAALVFLNSRAGVNTAEDRADAVRDRSAELGSCIQSGGYGGEISKAPGEDVREACERAVGSVEDYVQDKRFELTALWPKDDDEQRQPADEDDDGGVLGVTAIFVVIGAMMAGATFIGADWRYGTIGTLLAWEPRRLRVFFAKVAAVALVSFVICVVLQSLVGLSLVPSAVWRGTTDGADSEWFVGVIGVVLRSSALGAGAALIGYAVASLGRNTAAALGVAFGYVAVFEALVRGLKPQWQRWLIGENSTVVLFGEQLESASFERTSVEAGLILLAYLGMVVGAAALMFTRRDVAA